MYFSSTAALYLCFLAQCIAWKTDFSDATTFLWAPHMRRQGLTWGSPLFCICIVFALCLHCICIVSQMNIHWDREFMGLFYAFYQVIKVQGPSGAQLLVEGPLSLLTLSFDPFGRSSHSPNHNGWSQIFRKGKSQVSEILSEALQKSSWPYLRNTVWREKWTRGVQELQILVVGFALLTSFRQRSAMSDGRRQSELRISDPSIGFDRTIYLDICQLLFHWIIPGFLWMHFNTLCVNHRWVCQTPLTNDMEENECSQKKLLFNLRSLYHCDVFIFEVTQPDLGSW